MIVAKIHTSGKQKVLAACDKDLVGKKVVDEDLEFEISERFYGSEEVDTERFKEMLKDCDSANLVGKETTEIANQVYNLVKIVYIGEIPHAIIFKMK